MSSESGEPEVDNTFAHADTVLKIVAPTHRTPGYHCLLAGTSTFPGDPITTAICCPTEPSANQELCVTLVPDMTRQMTAIDFAVLV